jgi:nucleotide-binding universal stress UspA family protein
MTQLFKIDRVLLATDLSPSSEPVLRCATALASRFNAELYLLHVVPAPSEDAPMGERGPTTDTPERHAMEAMRRMRQELLAADDKYTTAVLAGDPAARILQKAEDVRADLIVVGTSARCPRPGGVTDTVVRSASCPVVTVPHGRQEETELRP